MNKHAGNIILLRTATLLLMVALLLAWCLVFLKLELTFIKLIFKDFDRLLQGHIDFLLMSALVFGLYAAKTPLPWHVRWSMVLGAFANPSLFVLMAIFPSLSTPSDALPLMAFRLFSMISTVLTTYGFGMGAVMIFRSTLNET